MLQARDLTRRYGALLAVDRVNFSVDRGEILGYLGPNGSGKSNHGQHGGRPARLVERVDFARRPHARRGPIAYKRRIGYVPEEPHLYTQLTAAEYLTLAGTLRGLPPTLLEHKIDRLLRLFLLDDSRYAAMSAYSKGMRQRVLLAAALLHDPDLLVLDEPFSGLDVTAGFLFRALLTLLSAEGRMVLFSSHRLDVVEKVCSRAVILSHGRIVAEERIRDRGVAHTAQSLEDVFVSVTAAEDYGAMAQQIFDVVRAA
jgi:ABC-2 type transport system ATP-binding protein